MRNFTVQYLFNGELRSHLFELKQEQLPAHEAALHLLELHYGDAENGLIMPRLTHRRRKLCNKLRW